MNNLFNDIQSKIRSKILLDYDMGKATWFRTGGKAKGYVVINNIKDLKIILSYHDQLKFYIIGVGSNLLVRDSGFDGLIYSIGFLVGWPIILFLIAEKLKNLGKFTFADV